MLFRSTFNNRTGSLVSSTLTSDAINNWVVPTGVFTIKDANPTLNLASGVGYYGAYKNILESGSSDNLAYWTFPASIPGAKHHGVAAVFIIGQYSLAATGSVTYATNSTSVVIPCTAAVAGIVGFSVTGISNDTIPAGAYVSSVVPGVSLTIIYPVVKAGATIPLSSSLLFTWQGSSQAYVMARYIDSSNCILFGYRGTNYIGGSVYNVSTQNSDIVLRVISGGVINDYPIVTDSTFTGIELRLEMIGSKACCYINEALVKEIQITKKTNGSFTALSGVNGSNTITTSSYTGLEIGQAITGTGIPSTTCIYDIKVTSGVATITLSNNLTANASGTYTTNKGINVNASIMSSAATGVGIRAKGTSIAIDGFCSYKIL